MSSLSRNTLQWLQSVLKSGLCGLQAFAAFDRCVARFVEGDSEADVKRRHSTFKLIPKVTKGSWVIRNAVGSTPVLLGKKLTTKYFRLAIVFIVCGVVVCFLEFGHVYIGNMSRASTKEYIRHNGLGGIESSVRH